MRVGDLKITDQIIQKAFFEIRPAQLENKIIGYVHPFRKIFLTKHVKKRIEERVFQDLEPVEYAKIISKHINREFYVQFPVLSDNAGIFLLKVCFGEVPMSVLIVEKKDMYLVISAFYDLNENLASLMIKYYEENKENPNFINLLSSSVLYTRKSRHHFENLTFNDKVLWLTQRFWNSSEIQIKNPGAHTKPPTIRNKRILPLNISPEDFPWD